MRLLLVPFSLVLFAAFAMSIPANATTVYIAGTFNTTYGGPLDGGTFAGSFDMTLPASNSFLLLSVFDVVMKKGSTTIEIKNGQSGSFGEVFGDQVSNYGALPIQFVDNKGDALDIYFATPFNGTGPVILHTSKGYVADAVVTFNQFSGVAQGVASLTPIPEPSTASFLFSGAACFAAAVAIQRFGGTKCLRFFF